MRTSFLHWNCCRGGNAGPADALWAPITSGLRSPYRKASMRQNRYRNHKELRSRT